MGLRFIFVTALVVSAPAAAQEWIQNGDGSWCGPEGNASSIKHKALDHNKNRFAIPVASDFDQNVSLETILEPGDDRTRWNDAKAAKLIGWVVDVKSGGSETCNCQSDYEVDWDTHIEVALAPNAPKNERVIVEVTPRLRNAMASQGVDWSTTALADPQTGILGRRVEFTGWLLFDYLHANKAENTKPGGDRNWRATAWELHPLTSIRIVPEPHVDATPHLTHLRAARNTMAERLRAEPELARRIDAANAKELEGLHPRELEIERHEQEADRRPQTVVHAPSFVIVICPSPSNWRCECELRASKRRHHGCRRW